MTCRGRFYLPLQLRSEEQTLLCPRNLCLIEIVKPAPRFPRLREGRTGPEKLVAVRFI